MQDEPKKLTHKQWLFCKEYLIDSNATQAYIRAGYSENGAQPSSSELLSNPIIQAKIAELEQDRLDMLDITTEKLSKQLKTIADDCQKDNPGVAVRAIDTLLGKRNSGKGINKVSTSPDGTVKIEFTSPGEE